MRCVMTVFVVLLGTVLGLARAVADGECFKGYHDLTPEERTTMITVLESARAAHHRDRVVLAGLTVGVDHEVAEAVGAGALRVAVRHQADDRPVERHRDVQGSGVQRDHQRSPVDQGDHLPQRRAECRFHRHRGLHVGKLAGQDQMIAPEHDSHREQATQLVDVPVVHAGQHDVLDHERVVLNLVDLGDGRVFELTWLSADDWWLELGRAAHVDTRTLRPAPDAGPVPDVIETPWELLLATGEAVQRRRPELLDQMVSDHSGATIAGDRVDSLETADDGDVRRWHEQLESTSRGRLHAAVMGRSGRGRPGAGIVEWVLFHDGWRSLTPFTSDGSTMVRIERVGAVDLPRALAARAAEVTS